MFPAPALGTPSRTVSPTDSGNDCAAGTGDSEKLYVPVRPPGAETVSTYESAGRKIGPTSPNDCCVNPCSNEPAADSSDHRHAQLSARSRRYTDSPPAPTVNEY